MNKNFKCAKEHTPYESERNRWAGGPIAARPLRRTGASRSSSRRRLLPSSDSDLNERKAAASRNLITTIKYFQEEKREREGENDREREREREGENDRERERERDRVFLCVRKRRSENVCQSVRERESFSSKMRHDFLCCQNSEIGASCSELEASYSKQT